MEAAEGCWMLALNFCRTRSDSVKNPQKNPDPDFGEDLKSRSLNGGSYKVPLVV